MYNASKSYFYSFESTLQGWKQQVVLLHILVSRTSSKGMKRLLNDSPPLFSIDFLYEISKPANQRNNRIMLDKMLVNSNLLRVA